MADMSIAAAFPRTQPTPTRFALREATQPEHMALEAAFERAAFFDSEAGYARWLTIMQAALSTFGEAYDRGAEACGVGARSEALSEALAQDGAAPGPKITPTATERSVSECAGIAYVFEGSAMGAQILLRRLQDTPERPTRYLTQLTQASKHRWQGFQGGLEQAVPDSERPKAIDGARATFSFLHSCFGGPPHEYL